MINQLNRKIIYTSIEKPELPQNLDQYKCDLVEVQNLKTNKFRKYLQFTHRKGAQQSFKVKLISFKKPSILMHVYKIDKQEFNLKGKIDCIAQSAVQKKQKKLNIKQDKEQSDDQYAQKKIILYSDEDSNNSDSSDGSQQSSKGLAPSKQNQGKLRYAVIQILQQNQKIGSIKEISKRLKKQEYEIKVPDGSIKEVLIKVCIDGQKKAKAYVLRPQFALNAQDSVKKKVKTN